MIAQAIKRYAQRRVVEVVRRVVVGTEETVDARLKYTQDSVTALINTAYIERVQATFRSRLAPLVRRRSRAARQRATLGGHVVGREQGRAECRRSRREGKAQAGV
jgi:hypothetical protein